MAKKDVIEEAAEFALSHPPNPISKKEVPKTNRCALRSTSVPFRATPVPFRRLSRPYSKQFRAPCGRFMVAAGGLEQGLNTAVNAAPLMIAPRAIIKCFEAACSGRSFREGLQVEQEQFTQLVFSVESKAGRDRRDL